MKILQNKKIRTLLLSILGGTLMGLSFPPFKTWFLLYFSLLILIYLVFDSTRLRQAFSRGYILLAVCSEITLYWISGWHSDDTFLKIAGVATVLIHPLFLLIPVLVLYGISRYKKNAALILFPFIMVGYEYFDNIWQFAFPWLELGNSEAYNINRIQFIEYTGVHGISFLICIITALLYYLIQKIYLKKWRLTSYQAITSGVIILILILLPNFYSGIKLNKDNSSYFTTRDTTKVVNISIAQTNTDPFKKWGGNHDQLIDEYLAKLREGLKFNPDMLVLHETAPPFYFLEDINMLKSKRFFDLVDSSKKYLVMGIPHKYYYKDSLEAPSDARITESRRRFDVFNSAILIEPDKPPKEMTIHKKVKLVPFSERIPYQEYLPFLKKLLTWGVGISGWQRGTDQTEYDIHDGNVNAKFAALICYESVFSEFVSEFTQKGAQFLIIVTNDGWWGDNSGPEQHNQYAVLRAIENRKWIARCAQTGVSCFIDPMGNIHDRIPYWQEGVINKNIIANNEVTFYAENGDIIGMISFYAGIICFAACFVIYAYNRKLKTIA